MESFGAKVIPLPRLSLGDNHAVEDRKQTFFNLFNKPIFQSKHGILLGIVHAQIDLRDLLRTFENTSKNLKVDLEFLTEQIDGRGGNKADAFIRSMKNMKIDKGCNAILAVIPNFMKNDYKKIKKALTLEDGVVTQVLTEGKFRTKTAQSIFTKVLLQILAKRGNTLWVPETTSGVKNVMLAGFDNTSKLISICATVNSTYTSVFSSSKKIAGSSEKTPAMTDLVMEAIAAYFKRNKKQPQEVIIFNNSCSGDQVKAFHEYFLEPLKEKISKEVSVDQKPNLTLVMVNTRTS